MNRKLAMIASAAILAVAANGAFAQQSKTTISLDTAKKMASACEALAKKEGGK